MRWQSISGEVPENISADSPLVFLIRIIGRVPAEMHVPDSFGVSVFFGSGAGAGSSTKAVVSVSCICDPMSRKSTN